MKEKCDHYVTPGKNTRPLFSAFSLFYQISQSSLCPSYLILLKCTELSLITATFLPPLSSPLPEVRAFFLSFLIQIPKYSHHGCVKGFQETARRICFGRWLLPAALPSAAAARGPRGRIAARGMRQAEPPPTGCCRESQTKPGPILTLPAIARLGLTAETHPGCWKNTQFRGFQQSLRIGGRR